MKKLLFIYSLLALLSISCSNIDQKSGPIGSKQPSTTQQGPDTKPPLQEPGNEPHPSHGQLKFANIPKLAENWWLGGASKAYEQWDRDTLYVWGANPGNYLIKDPKDTLGGGGMASANGPSRGHGHPHYIGVITTSLSKAENDAVFKSLSQEQKRGKSIVVPTFKGKWALGSGIAFSDPNWFNKDARAWKQSQYYLLDQVGTLAAQASTVDYGTNTFWPDCSMVADCSKVKANTLGAFALSSAKDLKRVKNYTLTMAKDELTGWQFPADTKVQMPPEQFYNLLGRPVGKDLQEFTAFTLVLFKRPDGVFEVLTQKRADGQGIEAPGGHLKGGQSWQEGALQELDEEAGVLLPKESLFYLQGGNVLPKKPKSNANFLAVFTDHKPSTSNEDGEIDMAYGHKWVDLKSLYQEVVEEETRLGFKVNGKYFKFFRGHINNFCKYNVKNLGICE